MMAVTAVAKNPFLSIGSFQAKTYFAELLRKVESGVVVTITRNGHDVAVMQSPAKKANSRGMESWQRLLKINALLSERNAASPVSLSEINEWKNDGKK